MQFALFRLFLIILFLVVKGNIELMTRVNGKSWHVLNPRSKVDGITKFWWRKVLQIEHWPAIYLFLPSIIKASEHAPGRWPDQPDIWDWLSAWEIHFQNLANHVYQHAKKTTPQWTRVQSDIDGHYFSFSSEKNPRSDSTRSSCWINHAIPLMKSSRSELGTLRRESWGGALKENKDCLCAASLNVQDLVLLVGSQRNLTISLRPIAAGGASKVLRGGGISHCTWPIRRGKSIYFPGTISTLNAVEDPVIQWLCSDTRHLKIYNGRVFS